MKPRQFYYTIILLKELYHVSYLTIKKSIWLISSNMVIEEYQKIYKFFQILENTVYGEDKEIFLNGKKVDEDFQIPIVYDRALKYVAKSNEKFIIKLAFKLLNFNEIDIDKSIIKDSELKTISYDSKKMITDLIIMVNSLCYINVELNNYNTNVILVRNRNYNYGIMLSMIKSGEEYEEIISNQINLNVHSFKNITDLINKYEYVNVKNMKKIGYTGARVHVNLDKAYEISYNKDVDDWTIRALKLLTSRSIKYSYELAGDYEDLKEIVKIMEKYSQTIENLIYYDPEKEKEKLEKAMIREAEKEGILQGISQEKISIAKKLLSKGTSISDVSEITGLTKDEIENL